MGRYGVTSNFIAPRARTRMTLGTPGGEAAFAAPAEGFDAWHPAWPARFVAFLASPAAAEINGQGFVVWGSEVTLYEGWHPVGTIRKDGAAFSLEELIARQSELFGDRPRAAK